MLLHIFVALLLIPGRAEGRSGGAGSVIDHAQEGLPATRHISVLFATACSCKAARFCALINKESLYRCGHSSRRWPFVRGATRVRGLGRRAHAHQRHAVTECHVEDAPARSPPSDSLSTASPGPFASPSDSGAPLSAFSSGRRTPEQQGMAACVNPNARGEAPNVLLPAGSKTRASACLMGSVVNRAGGSIRRFNIVDTTGNRMRVQVPTNMPLQKILQSFAAKHKVQLSNATFVHREVRVHPSDCPVPGPARQRRHPLPTRFQISPTSRPGPESASSSAAHQPNTTLLHGPNLHHGDLAAAPTCYTTTTSRRDITRRRASSGSHRASLRRSRVGDIAPRGSWSVCDALGVWAFVECACARERERKGTSLSLARSLSLSLREQDSLSRALSLSLSLPLSLSLTPITGS